MTRRDFERIAAAIRGAYPAGGSFDARSAWAATADSVANTLARTYPNFKRPVFDAACRPGEN